MLSEVICWAFQNEAIKWYCNFNKAKSQRRQPKDKINKECYLDGMRVVLLSCFKGAIQTKQS